MAGPNPYAQYTAGNPYAIYSMPAQAKPPSGFAVPSAAMPVVPLPGGPEDLKYIGQKAGIEANASARAQLAKEIAGARATAPIDIMKSVTTKARTLPMETAQQAYLKQLEGDLDVKNEVRKVVSKMNAERGQLTDDARNQALQKISALRVLGQAVQRSASMFDQTQNGGGLGGISEYLPAVMSDGNAKYDATVDALTPLAKAAFRVPGSGSDSDKESAAFMALLPSRWGRDAGNVERYRQMANIIQNSIIQQKRLLGLKTPNSSAPRGRAGGPAPAPVIDFNSLK